MSIPIEGLSSGGHSGNFVVDTLPRIAEGVNGVLCKCRELRHRLLVVLYHLSQGKVAISMGFVG